MSYLFWIIAIKMLLMGIWNGGLSDEAVEDMANFNLHVMCFLVLNLEDGVPDYSVLSRFSNYLMTAHTRDGLLEQIHQQI